MGEISPLTSETFDIAGFVETGEQVYEKLRPILSLWKFVIFVARFDKLTI